MNDEFMIMVYCVLSLIICSTTKEWPRFSITCPLPRWKATVEYSAQPEEEPGLPKGRVKRKEVNLLSLDRVRKRALRKEMHM